MAKRKGRPPKIDEYGREILREIVAAQPHATLAEVTAEFMRRTELTVTAATVLKSLRQAGVKRKRGAVVVKRRAEEEESKRYGYRDEHRRQEPEQRYPSCLTQTEWELVADLFEQPGKRGRPPQYSRWEMVNACCYVVRNGCSWRMLPHELPPWENVYRTFRRWAAGGKFEQMHNQSKRRHRSYHAWVRSTTHRFGSTTKPLLSASTGNSSPWSGFTQRPTLRLAGCRTTSTSIWCSCLSCTAQVPEYPLSTYNFSRLGYLSIASRTTWSALSRSCTTLTIRSSPRVSTTKLRLRPLTFLPAS